MLVCIHIYIYIYMINIIIVLPGVEAAEALEARGIITRKLLYYSILLYYSSSISYHTIIRFTIYYGSYCPE